MHDALLADFRAGRKAALARTISIVENHRTGFEAVLGALHASVGRARRIEGGLLDEADIVELGRCGNGKLRAGRSGDERRECRAESDHSSDRCRT